MADSLGLTERVQGHGALDTWTRVLVSSPPLGGGHGHGHGVVGFGLGHRGVFGADL